MGVCMCVLERETERAMVQQEIVKQQSNECKRERERVRVCVGACVKDTERERMRFFRCQLSSHAKSET